MAQHNIDADSSRPTYRAAIVGTGRIGNTYDDEVARKSPSYYQGENRHTGLYTIGPVNHAEAYQTTPGFKLIAGANRSQEKLNDFGARRDIQALYTDFRTMLRQEQPDVISVCSQSPEKAEITIAAAEAGVKAIVVEKAMATSMTEADAMIEACKRNHVLLVVNHPYRFSPLVRAAKQLVDDGAIGEITAVRIDSRGGMLHTGTHTLDMMRFFAGDAVELYARIPEYIAEKDLPAQGLIRFTNGITGLFDHTHRVQQCIEVRGTGGYLTFSGLVGDGWLFQIEPEDSEDEKLRTRSRLRLRPIEGQPHDMSTTQRMLAELHTSLSTGAPFISPAHDGAAALELGLACHASQLTSGPVQVPISDRDLRVINR